jgi:hypothetical protein
VEVGVVGIVDLVIDGAVEVSATLVVGHSAASLDP